MGGHWPRGCDGVWGEICGRDGGFWWWGCGQALVVFAGGGSRTKATQRRVLPLALRSGSG